MKIKKPQFKKNKKKDEPSEGAVFDLTAGNMNAEPQISFAAEETPDAAVKKSRFQGFRKKKEEPAPVPKEEDPFGLFQPEDDGFEVSVRNAEPIIRRIDTVTTGKGRKGKHRKKRIRIPSILTRYLQVNLATATIVTVMFCLLLMAAEIPEMIPFALPGFAVFMLFATIDASEDERVRRLRLYIALAALIALAAVMIIFRKYILAGWGLIMNQLYDMGELAQAYIYQRLPVGSMGDEHPYRSMHFALIWGSCLLGLLAALPPERFRRIVALVLAAVSMAAFAYYGLIPSEICIAILAAALLFALSRGSFLSSMSILLIAGLVFGGIMMFDPGESYGISRADENFRDRFAFRSAYLDGSESEFDEFDDTEQEDEEWQDQTDEEDEENFVKEHRLLAALVILLIVLAAIGVAVWMFIRRLRKRQAKNREGINSTDPREAIVAMFPYAVRWLQPAGIDINGKNFASLIPVIARELSQQYAGRFKSMYDLWEEAAYSDHEMTAEMQFEMKGFLAETMRMIKNRSTSRQTLINTIRYAL